MVRIIEVGPRDGLQNEKTPIPTEVKIQFVKDLVAAGLREIEVSSFVSPKWVPQLGDSAEVFAGLRDIHGDFSALVPNIKGLERAIETGVKRIAVFTAASDAFTQKNVNMTVAQTLEVFQEVIATFRASVPDGWVRGYVSTAYECPYAGRIEPGAVVKVSEALSDLGVDEISIGDTIGVASPREVKVLTNALLGELASHQLAYHFHDTRGTAIANVAAAYEMGIRAFDSCAAGLGGCPYAPGAGGNLATDDLVYFLEREGVATGIDPQFLAEASLPVLASAGLPPRSKAQLARLSACCDSPATGQ